MKIELNPHRWGRRLSRLVIVGSVVVFLVLLLFAFGTSVQAEPLADELVV
jgi:hypothetical protein